MEEDIKILLYLIEYFKKGYTIGKGINEIEITEENINSLENIAKAYKEDEAVIEEMAEYIKNPYKVNIISKGRMSRHQAIIEYFRNKVKEEVKDEQG